MKIEAFISSMSELKWQLVTPPNSNIDRSLVKQSYSSEGHSIRLEILLWNKDNCIQKVNLSVNSGHNNSDTEITKCNSAEEALYWIKEGINHCLSI
ncbi:hypothetical protein [Chamaesiphon sp.]|uniref:hypothetical protein n=1 Tax=Chamaesiphon sp. TaxID=2814140 RepID=UPI00359434A7